MRQFTRRFKVRHYELDAFHHVNNAVYVNYMQEAAIEASADAGFGPAWYEQRGAGWVIRKLEVRYNLPANYGDELDVTTWISEVKRLSTTREYLVIRACDGARIARGRANWVYLDRATHQPTRIPGEIIEAFSPAGEIEDLGIRLKGPQPTPDAFRYRTRRRVQTYEIDTEQHVNHAVFLRWIEQAYFDAVRSIGYPIEQTRAEGWLVLQGGHEMQYLEPAFDNDEIEITSWICEMGKVRGAWQHEVRCLNRNRLLARDYSLGIFVNSNGRLVNAPQHLVESALRGPVENETTLH
jgi:acyl-CoA thioester hydrolase